MNATYIPDAIVERVVEEIAGLDNDAIRMRMKRCEPFQPEVTSFVIAYTRTHADVRRALATVAMLTAYEAFRVGYVKTRKARERLVVRMWEDAADFVADLADQFHSPARITDDDLMSSEPALMAALMELAFPSNGADESLPVDDEAWHLLAVMYTIVETLHECAGAPRFEVEPAVEAAAPPADVTVALAWYAPENWHRMSATAEDEGGEESYEDWLAGAMETERELLAGDIAVERVMIDIDQLLPWLAARGRRNTAASRAAFAAELRRAGARIP